MGKRINDLDKESSYEFDFEMEKLNRRLQKVIENSIKKDISLHFMQPCYKITELFKIIRD